ncbi:hypothetical protein, partial [Vibrio genomosp. F10]|uniref:hypothetical protein n=1 Tax=Vibrio genomosp. F10 TaxID=723171 RepID=UPI001969D75E
AQQLLCYTCSYSLNTNLEKSLTRNCPKASQVEFLPVALSSSKVPLFVFQIIPQNYRHSLEKGDLIQRVA